MGATFYGENFVWGCGDERPLKNFPPDGKVRIRLRPDDWVKVYVKTREGIRGFHVKEENGFWVPGLEIGANLTKERYGISSINNRRDR